MTRPALGHDDQPCLCACFDLVFVRLCGWLVLSEKILFGELRAGQIVTVGVQGTGPQAQFTFEGVAKPEALCPMRRPR